MASASGSARSFGKFVLIPTGEVHLLDQTFPAGYVKVVLEFSCKECNNKFSIQPNVRDGFDDTFQCSSCNQKGRIVCTRAADPAHWLEMRVHGKFESESYKIKRKDILWRSNTQRGTREVSFTFNTSGHGEYFMPDEVYFGLFQTMPGRNESPFCIKTNLKLQEIPE